MTSTITKLGCAAAAIAMSTASIAQEATQESVVETEAASSPEAGPQVLASPPMPTSAPVDKPCELHVWPTENYLGIKMGLLSGFGALGALADMASNKGKVTTIKDLMREYLGPQVQMEELEKLDYMAQLGLDSDRYEVIVHEPTPFNEDLKDNPELKASVKEFNRKLKKDERVSDSTKACYAELVTTHIFYHKAMMYGSNLFTGWIYREFDGDAVIREGKGQVKNPLEEFPPKEEAMIETAQLELRDAYAKDFSEWVVKKSGS